MEDKPINEQEGLDLIRQMIHTAKKEQKDDGRGWIIWGWMLFLASVLTVANIRFQWFSTFFFWNLFGAFTVVAMIIETIQNIRKRNIDRVRTYTKDLFQKLNMGFFYQSDLHHCQYQRGGITNYWFSPPHQSLCILDPDLRHGIGF